MATKDFYLVKNLASRPGPPLTTSLRQSKRAPEYAGRALPLGAQCRVDAIVGRRSSSHCPHGPHPAGFDNRDTEIIAKGHKPRQYRRFALHAILNNSSTLNCCAQCRLVIFAFAVGTVAAGASRPPFKKIKELPPTPALLAYHRFRGCVLGPEVEGQVCTGALQAPGPEEERRANEGLQADLVDFT